MSLLKKWRSMSIRCKYFHPRSGKNYVDKGIQVEWKSFKEFQHDMGPTYFEGAVLDRKGADKNYSKENCRWVTELESRRNTSRVKLTPDKANEIRKLFATRAFTHRQLAIRFNVCRPTITKVVNGQHWT
jgi:hypothetical protein